MRACPLCGSKDKTDYPYKTYATCVNCQHTYQPDPPPKTYLNPDESFNGGENSVMSDYEKAVNSGLANWLFERLKPTRILDIGSAYPYFPYCFSKMGCDVAALDGIYDDDYQCDLDVPRFRVNWEDTEDNQYHTYCENDLITMIHVVEHFLDPVWCLKRAYDNLIDGGYLYVRSPNKDVAGIERDHTEGHTLIHPSIFGNQSLLYAATKVGFTLIWSEDMHGHGQSSWIFKKGPIKISSFMIVKNEEVNILACLKSIKEHVYEMIVLDTGSTDKTKEIARSIGATVIDSNYFNQNTSAKDFDFAKARNEAMRYATGDWLIWMDADDRLECDHLRLSDKYDAYYGNIKYGNTNYNQVRLFRNNWGVYFKGAIHEYPVIDQLRLSTMDNCDIHHLSGDKPGRVERNLAILKEEYARDPHDKRTIFYLANSLRESGKHLEAVKYYQEYINAGGNFHDELVLAYYYKGLSYYCVRQYDQALTALHQTMAFDDRWGEAYSLAGECYYFKQQYRKAISYLTIALEMQIPRTIMFVEKNRYDSIPKLWISRCYEQLGDLNKAKEYATGNEDRQRELNRKLIIEVRRPGALGDILCTTPAVRELKKKFPEAYIRYVTHPSSVEILRNNPYIDEIVTSNSNAYSNVKIEFMYPMHEGYPEVPMKQHLVKYFADNASVELSDDKPVLNLLPQDFVKLEYDKPVITFAVRTGWSRYKEWPLDRWLELIKLLPEYQFVQLGGPEEPKIDNAEYMCGKLTLRESFSVLSQSVLFVGLDSVFNHATRALNVPAVILFGSTSPIGSGYVQNTNLWSSYECSPCYREDNTIAVHKKPACPYAHKCMVDYMTVNRVLLAIKEKLEDYEC